MIFLYDKQLWTVSFIIICTVDKCYDRWLFSAWQNWERATTGYQVTKWCLQTAYCVWQTKNNNMKQSETLSPHIGEAATSKSFVIIINLFYFLQWVNNKRASLHKMLKYFASLSLGFAAHWMCPASPYSRKMPLIKPLAGIIIHQHLPHLEDHWHHIKLLAGICLYCMCEKRCPPWLQIWFTIKAWNSHFSTLNALKMIKSCAISICLRYWIQIQQPKVKTTRQVV